MLDALLFIHSCNTTNFYRFASFWGMISAVLQLSLGEYHILSCRYCPVSIYMTTAGFGTLVWGERGVVNCENLTWGWSSICGNYYLIKILLPPQLMLWLRHRIRPIHHWPVSVHCCSAQLLLCRDACIPHSWADDSNVTHDPTQIQQSVFLYTWERVKLAVCQWSMVIRCCVWF